VLKRRGGAILGEVTEVSQEPPPVGTVLILIFICAPCMPELVRYWEKCTVWGRSQYGSNSE
jgi:hypothetical protein